jgi:hypothetical protein
MAGKAVAGFPPSSGAGTVRVRLLRVRQRNMPPRFKQVKGELGRADFQVRSDIAIRHHQGLVSYAFSFC